MIESGLARATVSVDLTAVDLSQIDQGASRLKLEGARLPEAALKMTGR